MSRTPTILMLLSKTLPDLLKLQKKLEVALLRIALACGTFAPCDSLSVGQLYGGGHQDRAKMIFEG